MAVMPEPVNTRKIAMIEEYGFTASEVAEGGFTDEYLEVIGWLPEHPLAIPTPQAGGELVKTRIGWKPEDRQRAHDAIMGDYRETFGQPAP